MENLLQNQDFEYAAEEVRAYNTFIVSSIEKLKKMMFDKEYFTLQDIKDKGIDFDSFIENFKDMYDDAWEKVYDKYTLELELEVRRKNNDK